MTTFLLLLLALGCCFVYSLVLAIRSRQKLFLDYCNGLLEEKARKAAEDESRRKRINDAMNGSRLDEQCEVEPTTKSCLGLLPLRCDIAKPHTFRREEPTMEQIRSDTNAFIERHYQSVVLDEALYESRRNELLASGIRVEVVPEVFHELEALVCRNRDHFSSAYYFEKQARCVAFRMLKLNSSTTIDALLELSDSSVIQAIDIEYPQYSQGEKEAILTAIRDWKRCRDKERVQDILNAPPEKAILEASIPQASSGTKGKARL